MTEKELHKLKRHDLLLLLVGQGRETHKLKDRLEAAQRTIDSANELTERLKGRLNEKDAQIDRLKDRLDIKDAKITDLENQIEELIAGSYLEMNSAESLREISYRVELTMRAAQRVADRYIRGIKDTGARGSDIRKGTPVAK